MSPDSFEQKEDVVSRVSFDDDFSIELPTSNVSLPNYGFEAQNPIYENFGIVKQWFGSNVSIEYFSFKNEDIKNEIFEEINSMMELEKIDDDEYIILKSDDGTYNVFYFEENNALKLSGSDLDSLLILMNSVEFSELEEMDDSESIPYTAVERIIPFNETGLHLPKQSVCDVCDKRITTRKSWFVPKNMFYSSKKYREWIKNHYSISESDVEFDERISKMESNDYSQGSAVCGDCIHLFR